MTLLNTEKQYRVNLDAKKRVVNVTTWGKPSKRLIKRIMLESKARAEAEQMNLILCDATGLSKISYPKFRQLLRYFSQLSIIPSSYRHAIVIRSDLFSEQWMTEWEHQLVHSGNRHHRVFFDVKQATAWLASNGSS